MTVGDAMADYELRLTVLTPLHIRLPDERRKGWDFVVEEGQVMVLHLPRLYRELWPGFGPVPTPDELLAGRRAAPYAAYRLRLQDEAPDSYWPVVRDPMTLQPYVPGTSLKGLLRSALVWQLFDGNLRELGDSVGVAAALLERHLLGGDPQGRRDPNYSVARALMVEDLRPMREIEGAVCRCELLALRPDGRLVSRVSLGHLEVVMPGAVFQGRLRIDDWLLRRGALNFPASAVEGIKGLPAAVQAFGKKLLEAEASFYRAGGEPGLAALVEAVGRTSGAVARLGWGGGWPSKTVGLKLRPEDLRRVAQQFRLRRWQGRHFPERFPASRRLVVTRQGRVPLGWVRLDMKPIGG